MNIERLEALLEEVLPLIGPDALSPEARAIYEDLTSGDEGQVARGRAAFKTPLERIQFEKEWDARVKAGKEREANRER